jgi:hypothetical protein
VGRRIKVIYNAGDRSQVVESGTENKVALGLKRHEGAATVQGVVLEHVGWVRRVERLRRGEGFGVDRNFRDNIQGHLEPPITQERCPVIGSAVCRSQQGAKGWGLEGALGLHMVTTERLFQDPGGCQYCTVL